MMGRNHVLVGMAGWLVIAPPIASLFGTPLTAGEIAAGTLLCGGTALLPDVDHPNSTVAHTLGPITQGICSIVGSLSGGHRQKTHTLVFAGLMGVAAYFLLLLGWWAVFGLFFICGAWALRLLGPTKIKYAFFGFTIPAIAGGLAWYIADNFEPQWWMVWAVAGGSIMHLAGDIVTKGGVPLFWPIPGRISLGMMQTNGLIEQILTPVLSVLILWLGWSYFGQDLVGGVESVVSSIRA
jgi:membrane-bound metal-dependent hydrolase YbcI (DUF457 family)